MNLNHFIIYDKKLKATFTFRYGFDGVDRKIDFKKYFMWRHYNQENYILKHSDLNMFNYKIIERIMKNDSSRK